MKKIIIFFLLGFLIASCHAAQPQVEFGLLDWKYGDLRLLDPSDTDQSSQDLLAVLTRFNGQYFQMRIDFLDLGDVSSQDIYIAIDTNPGGASQISDSKLENYSVDVNWDYLVKISSSGEVKLLDKKWSVINGAQMLVVRERKEDYIALSLKKNIIPLQTLKTRLQIIVTKPGQYTAVDESAAFSLDAPSPPRAKVIIAFWNTFNPATPATTLRSWAGAHTGPASSRHGLKYLLDAAEQSKSTVFLLDLIDPDVFSALDYIGELPKIQSMVAQGLLILPYSGWDNDKGYENIRTYKNLIMLMDSLLFGDNNNFVFSVIDYAQYNTSKCLTSTQKILFIQSLVSLSLECKRLFVTTALENADQPIILGGDFSSSGLGEFSTSLEFFSYLKSHPWIQILTNHDLNGEFILPYSPLLNYTGKDRSNHKIGINTSSDIPSGYIQTSLEKALDQAPDNLLSNLARQVYYNLVIANSSELLKLQANYLGQVGEILAAAEWANNPHTMNSCTEDLDYDGFNECILANQSIFAIVEPIGGYLPFVFSHDGRGVHQLVGPTWEFMVGISDSSTWDISLGIQGDQEQILGGFVDDGKVLNIYKIKTSGNSIELSNDQLSTRKTFLIFPDTLEINVFNTVPLHNRSSLPLVLDPWVRYTQGWGDLYTGSDSPYEFTWSINSQISVNINSTNPISSYPFNKTRIALFSPEDPNFDYQRGHYLPFPMALIEIEPSENYSVEIHINP